MKDKDVDAIAFDAFGTLCRVTAPKRPFPLLFQRLGMASREAGQQAMTLNLDFMALARLHAQGRNLDLDDLQQLLREELDSTMLYPEVPDVLQDLKEKGYLLAVVSNLAKPYAEPVKSLLAPYIDEFIWSFEVGAVKPDRKIFAALCQRLGCLPMRVLMVGDSWEADVMGGSQFGMPTLFVDRLHENDPSLGGIDSLLRLEDLPGRKAYSLC